MGGNIGKENYSSGGLSFPFGYIEKDKEGFNLGLNLSASTPWPGAYGEMGGYAEVSWNGHDKPTFGRGGYEEVGVSADYMGFGVYTSSGNCYDSRNKKETISSKPKYDKTNSVDFTSNKNYVKPINKEIVRKVYRGEYGNGQERKTRLEREGYNYSDIQSQVNKIYYNK